MDKKLFGTRINKARKDRGLTAEKLAEACNTKGSGGLAATCDCVTHL